MRLPRSFLTTLIRVPICLLALFVVGQAGALASEKDSDLLDALLAIEKMHPSLCKSGLDVDSSRKRISALAEEVRTRIAASPAGPESAVQALNGIIFGPGGVKSSQDLHDPCHLLVSGVLARGKGYCVGIAAVYLAVAQELGLPVYAVGTPSHVFLRYDDGTTRINIETSGGAAVADAQYVEQQRIAPESVRNGVFLQNLTAERFLAQVHNNLGVIYSERQDFYRAGTRYETALRLDRRLAAAWYNLGKDLQQQGRRREAVHAFTKALRLHPNDTWALNNRGMTYLALDEKSKARRDLEAALTIDPAFEQARANLATVSATE